MSATIRKERSDGRIIKYKDAFSLRDEIDTCLNIEVEIGVTDKPPFLLDHIMLKKRIKSY